MSNHFPNANKLLYARLERPSSGSFITYQIPGPGLPNLHQVEKMVKRKMPGWELIHATAFNPDED